jgi:hypothetical protein
MTRSLDDLVEPPQAKACGHCGGTFYRRKKYGPAYWARALYCSVQCRKAARLAARPSMEQKFHVRYRISETGCWEWTAGKDKDGYGAFLFDGKMWRAPIASLLIHGRPVPPGMYACHKCDNPGCVNPDHLYAGTPSQNVADMIRRRRNNPPRKLSVPEVIAIRSAAGTRSEIASQFDCSPATVGLIKTRKLWKHVP